MDSIIWEGKEIALEKLTLKLARVIEAAEYAGSVQDAYAKQHDLVKMAIGAAKAKELLGTSNLEDVDLVTLTLLYNEITSGYEKRIADQRQEMDERAINSPTVQAIGDLAENVKVIQAAGGRK